VREGVNERGFADVGPANDGELEGGGGVGRLRCRREGVRGKEGGGGIHEGADAALVDGADGENGFKPQLGEFIGSGFGLVVVGLVDGEKNGFAGAAKAGGDFAVQGNDTFVEVDNKDDDGGG